VPSICSKPTAKTCAGCRSRSARPGSPSCCTVGIRIALNEHYVGDGEIVYQQACRLGCEGIVSKRRGSLYRSGRSKHWVKVKNPAAPAVRREAEEDWRSGRVF
jgi:ATP-dependent DNA ligase